MSKGLVNQPMHQSWSWSELEQTGRGRRRIYDDGGDDGRVGQWDDGGRMVVMMKWDFGRARERERVREVGWPSFPWGAREGTSQVLTARRRHRRGGKYLEGIVTSPPGKSSQHADSSAHDDTLDAMMHGHSIGLPKLPLPRRW